MFLPIVLKFIEIKIGLPFHYIPNVILYFVEIRLVHSFEVLPQPSVVHHSFEYLSEHSFLDNLNLTKQILRYKAFS